MAEADLVEGYGNILELFLKYYYEPDEYPLALIQEKLAQTRDKDLSVEYVRLLCTVTSAYYARSRLTLIQLYSTQL